MTKCLLLITLQNCFSCCLFMLSRSLIIHFRFFAVIAMMNLYILVLLLSNLLFDVFFIVCLWFFSIMCIRSIQSLIHIHAFNSFMYYFLSLFLIQVNCSIILNTLTYLNTSVTFKVSYSLMWTIWLYLAIAKCFHLLHGVTST